MTDAIAETPVEPPLLASERWGADARARDRKFTYAVGAAMLLHSMLLFSVSTSTPRQIGDPGGAENAVSVDLITEADLKSMSAVAEKGGAAGQPTDAQPPVQQPPQPEQQPQPAAEAAPEAQVPPATEPAAEPPQPEPTPEAKSEFEAETKPEVETKTAELPSLTDDLPDLLSLPLPGSDPGKKPPLNKSAEKIEQKPPQAEKQRSAKLDLSTPAPAVTVPAFSGSGSAGFERPPGITKSGANDAFARGVIRALQATMPQLSNTFGRVTVRITLNETGNLADVKVVRPSDIAGLDQNVMFATRQTNYPFPPPNSKGVDRVFVVTYIYR